MPILHCFFNKSFKASKCATLLKLTIPRIMLLRNRREVQLKQMRSDIAKLLETGQEVKASVKVEHVIREENMMAAQDIIQLFCELVVLRLPMIQSQRECPLDLKEAISSVCFAAPRCADLAELLQVQLLFASKYGKDFVSAATELSPDCSVNRQLIELLSIQTPSPEKKLKLLKEIAVEHKIDWDPTTSETKFFQKHEDLLNGPIQFCRQSESKFPLPEKKHTEVDIHSSSHSRSHGSIIDKDKPHTSFGKKESKQFMPSISRQSRNEGNQDLQNVDVLAAAETAQNAAGEAHPAVNIAQAFSSKLTKKNRAHVPDNSFENPFYAGAANKCETEREHFTEQNTAGGYDGGRVNDTELEHAFPCSHSSSLPSFDTVNEGFGSFLHNHSVMDGKSSHHQLKRLPSVDYYSRLSYPNLFTSQNSNIGPHSFR